MASGNRWTVPVAAVIVAATAGAIVVGGGTETVPLALSYPAIVLLAFRFGPLGGAGLGLAMALMSAGLPLDVAHGEYPSTEEILLQAAVLGSLGWLSGHLFRLLQRQADHLVELTRTLDRKVEQRTAQLAATNRDLERAITQRDELLTIIAHDLRAPFNGIIGFSSLLAARGETMPRDKILSMVTLVHDAATEAHHLLESLLEWARLRAAGVPAHRAPVSAGRLLDHAVAAVQVAAQAKDIVLDLTPPADDLVILADQDQVATVLRNLLSNAVKFTPRGGTVRLSLSAGANRQAIYSIDDSGVGMTEDQVASVFAPLAKRPTRGTDGEAGSGFGLGICQQYLRLNGGDLAIDSAPGEGTRITVRLPIADATPEGAGEAHDEPEEVVGDDACSAG